MIKVIVEAEVKPTEDENKVKQAILNLVTPNKVRLEERFGRKFLVAEAEGAESLLKLHSLLRREQILDAARKMMKKWSTQDKVIFFLNKQVAYVGHLSFCMPERESPLGPIRFEITCKNAKDVIDWLAPPTSRGKPLFEREPPN
ncbi:MAG: hypothetical protein DRJ18_01705 [Candidatus Methanomethylicota archaeon]|nr:hypothetical protein [Candidatus Culexmicrobium cathedralense]RLE48570.1 MAG: hypothetical protein DRJ18_01705 [Candidatus Verstraetearchaeota archaeon]